MNINVILLQKDNRPKNNGTLSKDTVSHQKRYERVFKTVKKDNLLCKRNIANENEGMRYSAGSSGVIFDKVDDRYYALTAYHVVNNDEANSFIIATALTPTYAEYREEKGITGYRHIPVPEYYELMPEATVEYQNEESDLAIISFKYSEELNVAKVAADNPDKGSRIVCIGNPVDNEENFVHTFGKIKSSKEIAFDSKDGQVPCKILKHSAYEAPGSSGGAVFSEKMELVGINIGGGTDFLGRFRYGAMIPSNQITECIKEWHME